MSRREVLVQHLEQVCVQHHRLRRREGLVRLAGWLCVGLAALAVGPVLAASVIVLGVSIEYRRYRHCLWNNDAAAQAVDAVGQTGGLIRSALAVHQGHAHGSEEMGQAVVGQAAARIHALTPPSIPPFRFPWAVVPIVSVAFFAASFLGMPTDVLETLSMDAAEDPLSVSEPVALGSGAARKKSASNGSAPEEVGTTASGTAVGRTLDGRAATTGIQQKGAAGASGGTSAGGVAGTGGRSSTAAADGGTRNGGLAQVGSDPMNATDDRDGGGSKRNGGSAAPDADKPVPEVDSTAEARGPRDEIDKAQEDLQERLLWADGDFGRDHGEALGEREAADLMAGLAPNITAPMVTQDSEVAAPGIGGVNDSSGTSLAMTGPTRLPEVELAEAWVETAWQQSGAGTIQTIEGGQAGGRSALAYQDIYTNYQAIAESAVRAETIPPTRRHYIRRYFDAIRPTEDTK